MNRYAARGIAQDAQDGRRVLVVCHNITAARAAFDDISALTHGADRIIRANGGERIDHRNGGRVLVTTPRSTRHRGAAVDIIYIDAGTDQQLTPDQWNDLLPCLATSPQGELIRA